MPQTTATAKQDPRQGRDDVRDQLRRRHEHFGQHPQGRHRCHQGRLPLGCHRSRRRPERRRRPDAVLGQRGRRRQRRRWQRGGQHHPQRRLEQAETGATRSHRDAVPDEANFPETRTRTMTTIKLTGGDLGRETVLVRADLRQAGGVIEVDYCEGSGWHGTQYQVGETRHRVAGLITVGRWLAADAVGMTSDEFRCTGVEID